MVFRISIFAFSDSILFLLDFFALFLFFLIFNDVCIILQSFLWKCFGQKEKRNGSEHIHSCTNQKAKPPCTNPTSISGSYGQIICKEIYTFLLACHKFLHELQKIINITVFRFYPSIEFVNNLDIHEICLMIGGITILPSNKLFSFSVLSCRDFINRYLLNNYKL